MKTARLFSLLGSLVLFGSAIFHTAGYIPVTHILNNASTPLQAINLLKRFWLAFSLQLTAQGVIVLFARRLACGSAIILCCAVLDAASAALFGSFVGLFAGFYLISAVAVLLFIGGFLQAGASATHIAEA
jgi:hypothetical protein